MIRGFGPLLIAVLVLLSASAAVLPAAADAAGAAAPFVKRDFNPTLDGKWIGNGISYGAYRDGEGPNNGKLTSKANILEDLQIVANRWNLIRLYGSGQQSRNIIEAFDEKWKGGFDGDNPMDKAEKHWGLYRSDRTPKQALR